MKTVKWVLDGEIMEDAGDVGGDIQIGPAVSIRFRSDEQPDARFEVTAYATAKLYSDVDEEEPTCPHKPVILERHGDNVATFAPMSPEHMACGWKPGTVDVQAEYTYRRNGRVEHGIYESDDSDHIAYDWVGSDTGYDKGDGIVAEVERATISAKAFIEDWVASIDQYLFWDGVSEVKS